MAAALLALGLLAPGARAATLDFHFDAFGAGGARGLLDLGVVAAQPGRGTAREARVRHRIAVRLEGGADAPASARVSVALPPSGTGARVRVDGVLVGSAPRLIDATHRVGTWVVHEIEVTVASEIPAGPLLEELQWFAEAE